MPPRATRNNHILTEFFTLSIYYKTVLSGSGRVHSIAKGSAVAMYR